MDNSEVPNKIVYHVRAMDDEPDGKIVAASVIAEGDPEEVMQYLANWVGEAYLVKYGEPPVSIYISPIPYHPDVDEDEEEAWLENQEEFLDGPEI
jgi:hypothetical protein